MLNDVSFLLFRFVEEEDGEEQWRTRNDVFVGSNDYIYRHTVRLGDPDPRATSEHRTLVYRCLMKNE